MNNKKKQNQTKAFVDENKNFHITSNKVSSKPNKNGSNSVKAKAKRVALGGDRTAFSYGSIRMY